VNTCDKVTQAPGSVRCICTSCRHKHMAQKCHRGGYAYRTTAGLQLTAMLAVRHRPKFGATGCWEQLLLVGIHVATAVATCQGPSLYNHRHTHRPAPDSSRNARCRFHALQYEADSTAGAASRSQPGPCSCKHCCVQAQVRCAALPAAPAVVRVPAAPVAVLRQPTVAVLCKP
jgi:hypothetical protein